MHPLFSTGTWVKSFSHLQHCLALAAGLLVLAACAPEPAGPAFEPSALAREAPRPLLGETAPFRAALAAAPGDAERLAAGGTALGARSAALQARAAALQGPVIEPARRERLLRAAGAGS